MYKYTTDTIFTGLGYEFFKNLKILVNQELQKYRDNKIIGSSLDADVKLVCWNEIVYQPLNILSNELHYFFGTSSAEVEIDESIREYNSYGVNVFINKSIYEKCGRCWHKNITVGKNLDHIELCSRCVENVFGKGEERIFF